MSAMTLTNAPATEFSGIYAAHHAESLRLAYLLTGDRHHAEDVVADAFVKVYRRWRRGGIDQPRAYIRRAVVNESNSRFRRLALERRAAQRLTADDRGARVADEQLADADQVFQALRRLPERQRTALVLRYYADLPERDIAQAMDVSVGTVKSSVSRALDKLRDVLGEEVA